MSTLTPKDRAMLKRIQASDGNLLVVNVVAAGPTERRRLETLIAADLVEIVDHPTVTERWRKASEHGTRPAAALAITDAGRAALKGTP